MILKLSLTLIVGLFILIGTIIGKFLKNNENILNFSISLSFGLIVSLIALELFPEIAENILLDFGFEGIVFVIICVILGFMILYQLDSLIPHHEKTNEHHHHQKSNCNNEHLKHIGIVTSIALILHNIIEGMSLYITTSNDIKLGIMLCIGIGLHNLPMGLVIESTLRSEYKFKKIFIISLIVSLATFIGGLITLFISDSNLVMGLLLSVTLGMLIYIAFKELMPQVISIKNKKIKYLGILTGLIILIISLFFG